MVEPVTYRLVRPPGALPARPSAEQRRVVDHRAGPMLVLGPAGSGKTWTLVEAVATRLERATEAVLVIADTAAVARRLRQALAGRAPGLAGRAEVTTWLALSRRLVEQAEPGLRLLGAAEQELRLRDLVMGQADAEWPQAWAEIRRSPAFARQVRRALTLLRRQGVGLEEVAEVGERRGRTQWRGLARVGEDYRAVLALEGAVDFDGLLDRAVQVAEAAGPGAAGSVGAVYVEHFEETEPRQVRLLAALAGLGGTVVAFADPRQATGAFRGAQARSALGFPDSFPTADGRPASVVELVDRRRQSPELRRLIEGWERRLPWPAQPVATVVTAGEPEGAGRVGGLADDGPAGVSAGAAPAGGPVGGVAGAGPRGGVLPGVSDGRLPTAGPDGAGPRAGLGDGDVSIGGPPVEVVVAESPGAEADWVAGWLRARHLEGLPWADMAIIVRSGRMIEPSASALAREGVPVEVTWTDLALGAEPLVGRLLGELTAAPGQSLVEALWETWQGSGLPGRIEAGLAGGPARRLAAERDLDAACALFDVAEERAPWRGPSGVEAFRQEVLGRTVPAGRTRSLELGRGVAVLTAHRAKGRQWAAVAVVGVQEGAWPALRPDRDLFGLADLTDDGRLRPPAWQERLAAERRLFHVAISRARRRLLVSAAWNPLTDVAPSRFLDELGAGQRLVERPGPDLTTAWGVIGRLRRAAADPQTHPAARQAALLGLADLAEAVDAAGRALAPWARPENWWPATVAELPAPAPGTLASAEAPWCAASAVFAAGVPGVVAPGSAPAEVLGHRGVGRRRRPDVVVPGLAAAAVSAGAALTPTSPDSPAVAGGVSPGSSARPPGAVPGGEEVVALSSGDVDGLLNCPRQWFLSRRARAERSRSPQALFGSVLHAVVQRLAAGRVDRAGAEAELDAVWDNLGFSAPWQGTAERAAATTALDRFEAWRRAQTGRAVVALEAPFVATLAVGSWTVRLTGRLDWLDRDDEGRSRVVDFKTSRSAPTGPEAARHRQLGVYQLAAATGNVGRDHSPGASDGSATALGTALTKDHAPGASDGSVGFAPVTVSGAELVFLRLDDGRGVVKTLRQPSLVEQPHLRPPAVYGGLSREGLARVGPQDDYPTWVHHAVAAAAQTLTEGRYPALPGGRCRWCPFPVGCPAHEDGAS